MKVTSQIAQAKMDFIRQGTGTLNRYLGNNHRMRAIPYVTHENKFQID